MWYTYSVMADPKNYQKYADASVRERAYEEALGRLRMGTFVALLGTLALGVTWIVKFPVAEHAWLRYGILGTVPLGALLGFVNYFRIPGAGKVTRRAIVTFVMTLVLAAATISLARFLKLL
jgi:hypothetical protein